MASSIVGVVDRASEKSRDLSRFRVGSGARFLACCPRASPTANRRPLVRWTATAVLGVMLAWPSVTYA